MSRGVHPGAQARSRAVFDRILSAAEALLDGRDWETITVEDICLSAEVSPSSFYRRFASKEALLEEIHERWLAGRNRAAQYLVGAIDWDSIERADVLRGLGQLFFADRASNSARSLSMLRVQVTHPHLSRARLRNDQENLDLVAPHVAKALGADLDRTRFGLLLLSAGLIASVQPPSPYAEMLQWDEQQLIVHGTAAFCGALGIDNPLADELEGVAAGEPTERE